MKLVTKKKYFDLIKAGEKVFDYRDAHITFVCEETGETLQKLVCSVTMLDKTSHLVPDIPELSDEMIIRFGLL